MLVLQHVSPPGSVVHKEDTVAEFDRQYMLVRLDDYRAALTQGEASLRKRKADLEASHKAHDQLILAAKGDMDKARLDLKTIPVLAALDAEKTRLAFQQAEAKYQQLLKEVPSVLASETADTKIAELNVEKAGIELKRAEANADKMIVKAPLDGLVVMQTTFRGGDFGQIQQGDQLWPGQFYMQIVDTHSMVINATVNQADIADIRLGQKARVHFDAYPDLDLPAHVESIAAVTKGGGFRQQFVREVPVRLRIDKMDKRVIPDLSVSAEVIVETDANPPAVIPTGAVFRDGGSSQKAFVFVQDTVGWTRRDVEIGLQNNLLASIKSGLKPGEIVALDRPLSPNEQGSP